MPRKATKTQAPDETKTGGGLELLQVMADAVKGAARIPAGSHVSTLVATAMDRLRGQGSTSFSAAETPAGFIACVRNCQLQCLVLPEALCAVEDGMLTVDEVTGITKVPDDRYQAGTTLANTPCRVVAQKGKHILVELASTRIPTSVGAQKQQTAAVGHVQSVLGIE